METPAPRRTARRVTRAAELLLDRDIFIHLSLVCDGRFARNPEFVCSETAGWHDGLDQRIEAIAVGGQLEFMRSMRASSESCSERFSA